MTAAAWHTLSGQRKAPATSERPGATTPKERSFDATSRLQVMKAPSESQLRYVASLRRELDVKTTKVPATAAEAHRIIDVLKAKQAAQERRETRQQAAGAAPSATVRDSIIVTAGRLGVDVKVPTTSAEAAFVLDDLRHRERKARRVADGSRS